LLQSLFRAFSPSQSPPEVPRKKKLQEFDLGGVSAFSMPRHYPGERRFQPRCYSIWKHETMAPKGYRTPISALREQKLNVRLGSKAVIAERRAGNKPISC
jgi:hypothetical protein